MTRTVFAALPAGLLLALAACGEAPSGANEGADAAETDAAQNGAEPAPFPGEAAEAPAADETPSAFPAAEPAAPAVRSGPARTPPRQEADPLGDTRNDPVPPPQPTPRQGLDPHAKHPPGNHMR